MNKISRLFLFTLLSIIFITSSNQAQLHLSLGPAIGYTIPSGDFGGSSTDFYSGTKYGISSGINFGAMGQVGLGPINLRLALFYSPLSNNGVTSTNSSSSVSYKRNLFEIAVGTQYGFGVPLAPVKPYIGLDILFTTISGTTTFQGTTSEGLSGSYDMNSVLRTGLGIGAGAIFKLLTFSMDISIRYNMLNLFSKRYEGSPTGNRSESYKYLNDDKDPNYSSGNPNHPIGSSRSIATLQLQLGVMFGL